MTAVWTRSLCDGRPTVHALTNVHEREANTEERMAAWGDLLTQEDEQAGRRLSVLATNCGIRTSTWLVEDVTDRFGSYPQIVRSDRHGSWLSTRNAQLLNARRCKRCWP